MDLTMSIAAASVSMHQAQLQQAVDISMAKKAMDIQEASAANLIAILQESQPTAPSFGHKLDIRV